jgi:hypothetical protein
MKSSLLKFFLILLTLAAACNAPEQEPAQTQAAPGSADADPAIVHHPEPPQRPSEKTDSIRLEGTYQRFTARLAQSDAPPRFSTYVPEDMLYEPSSSGEGDGHFFYTNFAGRKNEQAYMLIFVYPEGTDQAAAQRSVNSLIARLDTIRGRTMTDTSFQNSLFERAYFFPRNGITYFGRIALARHNDRFFHLVIQYPQEYADGFGPRADYIRRQWVWLDDGQGLGLTSPPPRESPE